MVSWEPSEGCRTHPRRPACDVGSLLLCPRGTAVLPPSQFRDRGTGRGRGTCPRSGAELEWTRVPSTNTGERPGAHQLKLSTSQPLGCCVSQGPAPPHSHEDRVEITANTRCVPHPHALLIILAHLRSQDPHYPSPPRQHKKPSRGPCTALMARVPPLKEQATKTRGKNNPCFQKRHVPS